MPTVSDVFKCNNFYQAICPKTKIWMLCQIVGIESDWTVRVHFVNWPGKKNFIRMTIPEHQDQEQWCIRKPVQKVHQSKLKRRDLINDPSHPTNVKYKVELVQYLDTVHFVDEPSSADLTSSQERKHMKTKVLKGWVCLNDPFHQSLKVWTECDVDNINEPDTASLPLSVKYSQLRASDWVHPDDHVNDEQQEEQNIEAETPKKQRRVSLNKCISQ